MMKLPFEPLARHPWIHTVYPSYSSVCHTFFLFLGGGRRETEGQFGAWHTSWCGRGKSFSFQRLLWLSFGAGCRNLIVCIHGWPLKEPQLQSNLFWSTSNPKRRSRKKTTQWCSNPVQNWGQPRNWIQKNPMRNQQQLLTYCFPDPFKYSDFLHHFFQNALISHWQPLSWDLQGYLSE